ncbi:STAS domain-containing protein [Actinomadura opuntiae]|uniref:STAS domain-containing protein n=1 Tax=Actinomadura sp. OS1-43 TaxID=604315 RepID=UPI00255AD3F1|nr:STAS domain-containing protein [Actinomadura sp. OS1-43]MDL4818538.1 STAS domain-containing protein [Actinomadura sp. OS1-43]
MTPDGSLPGLKLIVDAKPAGPWVVVELGGELDVATAPAVIDQVSRLLTMVSPPRIALDLTQVTFCDSSGLNAFVRLWKRAAAAGGELVLLRPRLRVAELLTRTRVDGHVRVCEELPNVSETEPGP